MKKQKLVSPSFLKQKARQFKRENTLNQAQALDLAAKEFGFSNYKNYLNALADGAEQIASSKRAYLIRISSESDEFKKLELAILFLHEFEPREGELFEILGQFPRSDAAVQSICEKSTLKDDVQSSLLNYFVDSKSDVQALPLKEHFVAKDVLVKNLTYELSGHLLEVSGEYQIGFEFEFDVPEEQKQLPHFNREPMFGDFQATIGRDGKITIDNPTIGESADGAFFMGSFKLGQ